jgi:hypothetical protein
VDRATKKRLTEAGFRVGDAGDFLGLTDSERYLVELRVQTSLALKRRREMAGLTQQQLADRIESSQSRVARAEAGGAGISFELMFRMLFAAGGVPGDIVRATGGKKTPGRGSKKTRQPSKPRKPADVA